MEAGLSWLAVRLPRLGADLAGRDGGAGDALQRLAAWCYQYSSRVVIEPDIDTLLLEAGASRRLFGPPEALGLRLRDELRQLGYHAHTGIAPTPEAACLAAGEQPRVIDRPALHDWLRALPLQALRLQNDQRETLRAMGFRNTGDLLRLPRKALTRRLGPALADYLDRLAGARPDPRHAWRPPTRFATGMDLPAEVSDSAGLLFALRRLVGELCGMLRGCDRGVQEIHLRLRLAGQGSEGFRLGLQRPCRDESRFMLLLRERLARLQLAQPARHVHLQAGAFLEFDSRQDALFETGQAADPAPLAALLERLQARLGPGAVRGLGGVQDHRPEHSWAWRALDDVPQCVAMPHRPAWLLRHPRPCRISDYDVLAGPERIESGWWDGRDCRRDYFVVRDRQGSTLWAFREYKPRSGWYVHGIFS